MTTDIRFFKKTDLVISVYNGVLFIMQFVHSIQNQNLTNIEIIIVDDSSTDNSVSIIKGLMKEDPRIMLLIDKESEGRCVLKQEVYWILKGNIFCY